MGKEKRVHHNCAFEIIYHHGVLLLTYFVPAIVANNKFKTYLFAPMHDDIHMCTVSNKTCALLLLENNYDCWIDVYKNKTAGTTTLDAAVSRGIDKRK